MKSLKQMLAEDYDYGDVDVPDKYDDLDFEPPAEAQNNAQQVIDWKEEHGEDEVEGMTQTGWQRANQLADGVEVSPDVISRMAKFARDARQNGQKRQTKRIYETHPRQTSKHHS